MKVTKTKTLKKSNIIISAVVLVALLSLGAYTIYAYTSSSWPFNKSSQNSGSDPDTKNPLGTPEETDPGVDTPEKSPSQYDGDNPNTAASLTGFISFSSVVDDMLVIRMTIDQALSNGTCTLTLTKNSESITKTSSIVANPSSSTCSGFDIPTTELSSGKWAIKITLTSDDKTGTITGEASI